MKTDLLKQRFAIALKRIGLQKVPGTWDASRFQPPTFNAKAGSSQASLF